MATYKSSYTGPQIDQAVSHAVNMDVNPTAGHTDRVVSSGGVKSAITNAVKFKAPVEITLPTTYGDSSTYLTGLNGIILVEARASASGGYGQIWNKTGYTVAGIEPSTDYISTTVFLAVPTNSYCIRNSINLALFRFNYYEFNT